MILSFHHSMVKRKYSLLFTPKTRGKPGPRGPSPKLISDRIPGVIAMQSGLNSLPMAVRATKKPFIRLIPNNDGEHSSLDINEFRSNR